MERRLSDVVEEIYMIVSTQTSLAENGAQNTWLMKN
jgi:hypothetical protein